MPTRQHRQDKAVIRVGASVLVAEDVDADLAFLEPRPLWRAGHHPEVDRPVAQLKSAVAAQLRELDKWDHRGLFVLRESDHVKRQTTV